MRKLIVSSVLLASLAAGTAAMAGTQAKPAAPDKAKAAACAQQWKAQKQHTQTRKAFMAACLKA
ncbi:PsiF family protein [Phenylobacterium sp.]|uniref:PsiF family protein n=1 Tax=Phenylobacterium sp. TaxID=1871053 RepID=UPI003922B1B0